MRKLGMGYRRELHQWLKARPAQIANLEITAEHFFDGGDEVLQELSADYDLFVHGLGLSLGTPGPMCKTTLDQFARIASLANATWVSEHVAFSRTGNVDLGHLNPVPRTKSSLDILVDHTKEVSQRCGLPMVLENITSSLDVGGELSETDFLNQLCDRAECGLLLDVTNLFINSRNLQYDPLDWLAEINADRIVQLHVVGYSQRGGVYHDHHSNPIQEDLMELIIAVLERTNVQAVTLERDERLGELDEIENELVRLQGVMEDATF